MCVSVCVSWEGGKGVEVQGFCWVVTEDREVKSNEEPPKVKDSEIQARERRSQPTSEKEKIKSKRDSKYDADETGIRKLCL